MKRRCFVPMAVLVATLVATAARADLVNYETVNVRDTGNANAATGYGAVAYGYAIGKYDVTIGQYTAFLNAVASTDTYGLYDDTMATDLNVAGISRSGASGSFTYSVMTNSGDSANRPITHVSWFDAARFANWMANGQPTGSQGATTTENGVYDLAGAISGNAPARNATNPNTHAAPTYWIPTENEWYKAAFYSGSSNVYWGYATQSNTAPVGNAVGGAANQANYLVNGVYATGGSTYSTTQNYLTDVGAYTGSASHYGTFDQSGLVYQWNDLTGSSDSVRGIRGGFWPVSYAFDLSAWNRLTMAPTNSGGYIGFRLAGVPVPEIDPAGLGSVLALVGGALGLLERRWPKPV